jgi:hypothetical protein
MKKFVPFLYFTLAAIAAVVPFSIAAAPALAQQQQTLYHRLGGYDAIDAVTDDFVARLSGDPSFTLFGCIFALSHLVQRFF